jgi:hypothetical protein
MNAMMVHPCCQELHKTYMGDKKALRAWAGYDTTELQAARDGAAAACDAHLKAQHLIESPFST